MRLHLKRVNIRGAVLGLALALGGGVLLAATPVVAASVGGPCGTPGAAGIAVAYAHGAPVACVNPVTGQLFGSGGAGGQGEVFLKP